jgi:hypothetical protein
MSTTQKNLKLVPDQISTTAVAISFQDLVANYYKFYCPRKRPDFWKQKNPVITTQLEAAFDHLKTHRFKGFGPAPFKLNLSEQAAKTLFTNYFLRAALEDLKSLERATVRIKEDLWVTYPPTYCAFETKHQYLVKEVALAAKGLYLFMLVPLTGESADNLPLPYLAFSKDTFLEAFGVISQ